MKSYMKRVRWGGLLVAGSVMLNGCSTMSIYTDEDPQARISTSQTYTWGEGTLPNDVYPALRGELVERTITRAVDRELQALGFVLAASGAGDLRVDCHLSATQQWETVTSYHEEGWEEVRDFSYTEGMLLVDLLDAESESLLWRGMATGVVGNDSPSWVTERIDEAVRKMFEELAKSRLLADTRSAR